MARRTTSKDSGSKLHQFEGRDVVGTRVAIVKAGDGLSKAMSIAPVELQIGDEVSIGMRGIVDKITYEPVKDTDVLERVQRISAGTVTIVSNDLLDEAIEAQERKIEQARGVERLDFEGEEGGASE